MIRKRRTILKSVLALLLVAAGMGLLAAGQRELAVAVNAAAVGVMFLA
jgi:hypothetical protein